MYTRKRRWSNDDLDRLQDLKDFIRQNLSSPLSLETLARKAGMNEKKLREGFRYIQGESLVAFIRKQRMQKAQDLLQGTDLSVADIAEECGYPDLSSFYRVFRKTYGCTPVSLRNGQE